MLICDQGIEQNAFIEMGCVKSNVRHKEKKTHYARTGNQNDFNDTGEKEILCISFKTMFGAHKNVKNVLKIKVKCYACVELYICYACKGFAAKYDRLRAYANLV